MGRRAYYVVPRIEQDEDDSESHPDIDSAFERLTKGTFKGVPASSLHGRMTSDEKDGR